MFYLNMEPIFPTVGKSDVLPAYGAYFPMSGAVLSIRLSVRPNMTSLCRPVSALHLRPSEHHTAFL